MGKYIEKDKITCGVGVMEASHHHQSSLGVRTRARTKTLALGRLQKSKSKAKPAPLPSSSSSSTSKSSSCYLQLRSRRLEKCFASKAPKANPRLSPSSGTAPSPKASTKSEESKEVEVSFGDNVLEVEGRSSRNLRETTPCSLIKMDSDTVETPGSTTRSANRAAFNRRVPSSMPRSISSSCEMEEFFAAQEKRQQKAFAEKYNFDPVKDCPLPGRYEWIKLQN